jgi:hypothetical protein
MLRERVRPAAAGNPLQLARWIEDLARDRADVRRRATQELEQLGDAAAGPLRQALEAEFSPRTQQCLAQMLAKLDQQRLAALRAVQVLEQIGTVEARHVLSRLAQGAEGAPLTCEAKAALERLSKRPMMP